MKTKSGGKYLSTKKWIQDVLAGENVNYRIVDNFNGLEIVKIGNVSCTSINQTINDMMHDFNNIDEQSLVEALSNYYFLHDASFTGLNIAPENLKVFNSIKDWAIEYYMEE